MPEPLYTDAGLDALTSAVFPECVAAGHEAARLARESMAKALDHLTTEGWRKRPEGSERWSFRNAATGDVYRMHDEADAHEMAQAHCRRAPAEVIRTRSFDEVVATYPASPTAGEAA